MNLPNLITVARIVMAVGVAPLILIDGLAPRVAAFALFVAAALSDLWDGHLARSRGLVTDLGKLLDPLADKLLLVATVVPLYILGTTPHEAPYPWFGGVLPLWIVIVLFGRELFITLFRSYASRRGVVIAAGPEGKLKTVFQLSFVGGAILWFALHSGAREREWSGGAWEGWFLFHHAFVAVTMAIAVALTVYSMLVYLWRYRRIDPD